jgi:hypothetical protein
MAWESSNLFTKAVYGNCFVDAVLAGDDFEMPAIRKQVLDMR